MIGYPQFFFLNKIMQSIVYTVLCVSTHTQDIPSHTLFWSDADPTRLKTRRVSVGEPKQSFSVLFDTASGHVLFPGEIPDPMGSHGPMGTWNG